MMLSDAVELPMKSNSKRSNKRSDKEILGKATKYIQNTQKETAQDEKLEFSDSLCVVTKVLQCYMWNIQFIVRSYWSCSKVVATERGEKHLHSFLSVT